MRKIQNKAIALRELFNYLKLNVPITRWWPAETRFEIFVGVVLTQNTAWKNVEKSLANLRESSLLEAENLLSCPDEYLQEKIRPSGFMRAKSACLKNLGRAFFYFDDEYRNLEYSELRRKILAIKGIGDESADTLCLYAYDKSCFIYDKYAIRMLEICALIEESGVKYKRAKQIFDDFYYEADFSLEEAKALHGLIVNANQWSQGRDLGAELNCSDSPDDKSYFSSDFETILFNLNEIRLRSDSKVNRDLATYLLNF